MPWGGFRAQVFIVSRSSRVGGDVGSSARAARDREEADSCRIVIITVTGQHVTGRISDLVLDSQVNSIYPMLNGDPTRENGIQRRAEARQGSASAAQWYGRQKILLETSGDTTGEPWSAKKVEKKQAERTLTRNDRAGLSKRQTWRSS